MFDCLHFPVFQRAELHTQLICTRSRTCPVPDHLGSSDVRSSGVPSESNWISSPVLNSRLYRSTFCTPYLPCIYISLVCVYVLFFFYLLLWPDVFFFPFEFLFSPATLRPFLFADITHFPALWRDVISNISCNCTHVMPDTIDRLLDPYKRNRFTVILRKSNIKNRTNVYIPTSFLLLFDSSWCESYPAVEDTVWELVLRLEGSSIASYLRGS